MRGDGALPGVCFQTDQPAVQAGGLPLSPDIVRAAAFIVVGGRPPEVGAQRRFKVFRAVTAQGIQLPCGLGDKSVGAANFRADIDAAVDESGGDAFSAARQRGAQYGLPEGNLIPGLGLGRSLRQPGGAGEDQFSADIGEG